MKDYRIKYNMKFQNFLFLLVLGTLSTAVSAKISQNRVNNNTAIDGFDDSIWENGRYPTPQYQRGGGISNESGGKISFITNSDFINNTSGPWGGGLENYGKIITMDNLNFTGNFTQGNGGGITNTLSNSSIGDLKNSLFSSNTANGSGGAIYNIGTISSITHTIFQDSKSVTGFGGAIYNKGTTNVSSTDFLRNTSKKDGGAIYNEHNIEITNSSFYDNQSQTGMAGAIANVGTGSVTLTANGKDVVFSGNKGILGLNDYYAASATTNIFSAFNGNIFFAGAVMGDDEWSLQMNGNQNGNIFFDNQLKNANIVLNDITVNANGSSLLNNTLEMNSGIFNIDRIGTSNVHFRSLDVKGGGMNLSDIDVDLENKQMGRISADTESFSSSDKINVNNLTIIKDSENKSTDVLFASQELAGNVSYENKVITAPIYEYKSNYNASTGLFNFTRNEVLNPTVQATNVGSLSNSILVEEIYSRVLSDIDRVSINHDRILAHRQEAKMTRGWVKYFGSNDRVALKNFRDVDTQYNGFILGGDSDKIALPNDWDMIASLYGAYVKGEQSYTNTKIKQDAQYGGGSLFFHKGSLFAGVTANVGYIENTNKTSYGADKYDTFVMGLAIKSGYNMRMPTKTIIQPNIFASYSYIKADNYTAKSGVDLVSRGLNIAQVSPGLRVIQEMKYNTDIYVDTRYVMTDNYKGNVYANNMLLPDIGFKNFIEYGIGIHKSWYGELSRDIDSILKINRRDGGRTGWNALAEVRVPF